MGFEGMAIKAWVGRVLHRMQSLNWNTAIIIMSMFLCWRLKAPWHLSTASKTRGPCLSLHMSALLQQPAVLCLSLLTDVCQAEGGNHLLAGDCPRSRTSHLAPLSRCPPCPPGRLSVSQLDWQVQSNHCVLGGPKLTPVTQLSQDKAGLSHPLSLTLCVLYWITEQLGSVHSWSNWKHVIKKKKQGCAPVNMTSSNRSTGQMEPVKDDIGMWHPHYEDFNVPIVGVKNWARTLKWLKGFCRPQNEVMFHQCAADRA